MVLKIQLQYLKMRASVPIYEAQCVVFTAAIRTNNDKLRVAGQGLGNTRARRANTAKRAPNITTHHHYVRVLVGTSFI